LTAAADATADAFTIDWPTNGTYLARLELRDKKGRLLSQNFYWHARDEHQLKELDSMPRVAVRGKTRAKQTRRGTLVTVKVSNPSKTPALEIRLTLRDAKTGQRVLPVYYEDNYFSLLPGESKSVQIETRDSVKNVRVTTDGWNIEPGNLD
jgi:hypothetical protein